MHRLQPDSKHTPVGKNERQTMTSTVSGKQPAPEKKNMRIEGENMGYGLTTHGNDGDSDQQQTGYQVCPKIVTPHALASQLNSCKY